MTNLRKEKTNKMMLFSIHSSKIKELAMCLRLPETQLTFSKARQVFIKSTITPPLFLYGIPFLEEKKGGVEGLSKNEFHLLSFLAEYSLLSHLLRKYKAPDLAITSSLAFQLSSEGGFDKMVLKIFSGLKSPSKTVKTYIKQGAEKKINSYKLLKIKAHSLKESVHHTSQLTHSNISFHPSIPVQSFKTDHSYRSYLYFGMRTKTAKSIIHKFHEEIQ